MEHALQGRMDRGVDSRSIWSGRERRMLTVKRGVGGQRAQINGKVGEKRIGRQGEAAKRDVCRVWDGLGQSQEGNAECQPSS